ncbi:hypothetical protein [Saccharopolyspora sp. SCSIO 74807]|uniref:hypothetical protein n=1 Tax=Saccharopolyspora sp. SCSIO 74807 TaxID=3118084 RepID=UPI0030D24D35
MDKPAGRRGPGLLRLAARACLPALTVDVDRHRADRRILTGAGLSASIAVLGVGDAAARGHVSALVAHALAAYQGSRVLAFDADTRSGALRSRLTESTQDSLNPVLAGLGVRQRGPRPDQPPTHRWARSRLTPGSEIALIAADPASPGPELGGGEYGFALPSLRRWWPLIVTDLPAPSAGGATERGVVDADRVVLVADQDSADPAMLRQAWQWLSGLLGAQRAAERVLVAEPARGNRAKPHHRGLVGDNVEIVPVPGMPASAPSGPVLTSATEPSVAAAQHVAARCLAPVADAAAVAGSDA